MVGVVWVTCAHTFVCVLRMPCLRHTVVDVHKAWCGRCSVMEPTWKRIFLDNDEPDSRIDFISVSSGGPLSLYVDPPHRSPPTAIVQLLYNPTRVCTLNAVLLNKHIIMMCDYTVSPVCRRYLATSPRWKSLLTEVASLCLYYIEYVITSAVYVLAGHDTKLCRFCTIVVILSCHVILYR